MNPHKPIHIVLAAATGVALVPASLSMLGARDPHVPTRPAAAVSGPPSPCRDHDPTTRRLLSARDISPAEILGCETAVVSVTLRASCIDAPLHVVIDLDRSYSMGGQPCIQVKEASLDLLDLLDMRKNPSTLVGLVTHGDPPTIDLGLTSSPTTIRGAINRVRCGNVPDNLAESIDMSAKALRQGRTRGAADPVDVMIVLSDGGQAHPAEDAIPRAGRARAEGIIVVSVCVNNPNWPTRCDVMLRLATSPRYYFEVRDGGALSQVFQDIGRTFRYIRLADLAVAETVPPGLHVVPGSVSPPSDTDPATGVLTWQRDLAANEPITYTYAVTPTHLGLFALASVSADYHDSAGRIGHIRVPTDTLSVPAPCVSPSPTAAPVRTPSPTATSTRGPSDTPTSTAAPARTATPRPLPVFLPVALREECIPGFQHTDVALVIDASTSMRDQVTSTGRSKLEAARDAVALFVSLLDLAGGDQAAIVQFNADAALLAPLQSDRASLATALSMLHVARQTRIQAGIHIAREELASARHRAANHRAMVVLTDGANNPEPVADAEREAAVARSEGIHVFTIGLGREVEGDALARMATSAFDYFHAPDGEDLAVIYKRIAHAIPCPSEMFWGRR